VISVSVCLFVHMSKFRQIFCTCFTCSVLLWWHSIRYVLPVLWTTSCFHIMERMGQNQRPRVFRPVHQVAAPGMKSDVSDRT